MTKKESRFWLFFDLGLRGDYGRLYAWLDSVQARECGDSAASFVSEQPRERITQELRRRVDRGARLYLVGKTRDGRRLGGFIVGKRKVAPWTGFAEAAADTGEEE